MKAFGRMLLFLVCACVFCGALAGYAEQGENDMAYRTEEIWCDNGGSRIYGVAYVPEGEGRFPLLYYYNSKKHGELDFVIERNGYVLPIEIKSGKDYYRHNAMDNVLSQTDYGIEEGYVFCGGNIEQAGKMTYFPIYMLMFLEKKALPDDILFETDFSDLGDPEAIQAKRNSNQAYTDQRR